MDSKFWAVSWLSTALYLFLILIPQASPLGEKDKEIAVYSLRPRLQPHVSSLTFGFQVLG